MNRNAIFFAVFLWEFSYRWLLTDFERPRKSVSGQESVTNQLHHRAKTNFWSLGGITPSHRPHSPCIYARVHTVPAYYITLLCQCVDWISWNLPRQCAYEWDKKYGVQLQLGQQWWTVIVCIGSSKQACPHIVQTTRWRSSLPFPIGRIECHIQNCNWADHYCRKLADLEI